MQTVTKMMIGFGLALAACSDTDSATDLNPVGPPMVRQVRLNHKIINADGSSTNKRVFAFGAHELAEEDELKSNQVTSAVAVNNSLRVIVDELLVGNNLEEIACRSQVDDDAFAKVPVGATPDDIARCAAADDVLPSACTGPTAVCMCAVAGGCISATGTTIAEGAPVGVLDINQDGATDDTQFVTGSVGLQCGTISVPLNVEQSYWQPSGNQNRPQTGGFDALGPAIVLTPDGPLPTNLDCSLVFDSSVVDKQGIQVCAPPDGDVTRDCSPGDMSAFTFHSEVLSLRNASFASGATGVSATAPIVLSSTAPLSPTVTDAGNITLVAATGPQPAFTVAFDPTMNQIVQVRPDGAGLQAGVMYTLTITSGVIDTYGQPPPAPQVFTFTTTN
jgi:hypothetical protein